ncbi:uncharacterized protein LOC144864247 [Branchiostoma floridae x Branchiostoma japonicum]
MSRRKQQNPTRLAEREGGEAGPSTGNNDTPSNGSLDTQNPTQQPQQDSQNPVLQNSFLQHITDIQKLQEQTQSLLNNAQKTQNILDTQASQMFKIGVPVDPSHSHLHHYARPGPSSPPVRTNTSTGLLTSPLAQPPFPGNIGFMPMPIGMMGLPLRPGMPIPPMLSPLIGHPGLLPPVVGKPPGETPSGSQGGIRQPALPGGGGTPHVMAGLQEGLTLEQLKVIQDIVSKFPKEKSVGPRIVAPSPELVQAWQNALHSSSLSTVSPTGQEAIKDGKPTAAQSAEQWQKLSQLQRTDELSSGGVSEGGNSARDEMAAAFLGQQQGMPLVHNGSSSAESALGQDAVDADALANEASADMELHSTIAKDRDVFSAPKSRSNFIRAERVGSLGYWTPGRPRRGRTFHTCHICGKVFRRPSEVQRHLRVHTGEQPFQCDLCYRRFNDKSNWRNHMIRVHRIESPVWPTWSHEATPRDDAFLQRASDSGENEELSDEAPNLEINDQENSDETHSSEVHHAESTGAMSVEEESQVEQEGLNLSTSVKDEPQELVKQEEEKVTTELVTGNGMEKGSGFPPTDEVSANDEEITEDSGCNNQEEQTGLQDEMMREKVKTEECASEMLTSKEGSSLQVKQEPPSPEEMSAASEQQFFFEPSEEQGLGIEQGEGDDQGSQDSLEDNTDPEKKIYHCETCQKPFSRVDSLRRHRILHTGVKPHGCPFCPYRTYYKGNLNVHMERAHSAELHDIKQRELFNFGTLAGNQAVSSSSQFVSDLNISNSMVQQPSSGTGFYGNPGLSNQMFGIHSNQFVTNEGSGLPNMEEMDDEDVEDALEEEAMEEDSQTTSSQQMEPGVSNISQSCNVCGEMFDPDNLTAEMVHHAAMHQTNKVSHDVFYSCNMCKAKFRSREGLENHKEQIHQSEVYGRMITKVSESYLSYTHSTGNATGKIVTKYFHRCNLCGKKFDRPSGALRHTRVHTGEKPFTCRICGMPFQDKSGLKAHTLRKHPEVVFNTAPGSELSPENYKTLSHINSQLNNLHGTGETGFSLDDEEQALGLSEQQESQDSLQASSCLLPNKTETQDAGVSVKEGVEDIQDNSPHQSDLNLSRENSQVDKNAVTKNGPIRKTSDTAYWPKRKKGAKKLARVAAVLLNGVPREGIPKGSIPVFRKGKLNLVRADDLKPNACSICGKRFWYKYDLRRHMTMHSDFRPHKCKFCKYRSRQLNQLKIHMQRHKGVFKPFRCPACDFSSSTKPEMKAHVARHLTIWTNHICPFCYYGFRTNEELLEHQSTKHSSVEGTTPSPMSLAPGNPQLSVASSFQQGTPSLMGMIGQNPSLVPGMAGIPCFTQNSTLLGEAARSADTLPPNHSLADSATGKEIENSGGRNLEGTGLAQPEGLVIQDVRSLQDSEGDRDSTKVFSSSEKRTMDDDLVTDNISPKSEDSTDIVQAGVQYSDQKVVEECNMGEGVTGSNGADANVHPSCTDSSDKVQYGKRRVTSTENECPSAKAARSGDTVQNSGATDIAGMNLVLQPTDELVLCNKLIGKNSKQDVELTPGQQLEFWVKRKPVAVPQCNGEVVDKATANSKCNGALELIKCERTDSDTSVLIYDDYSDHVKTHVFTKIEKVEMKCKACNFTTVDEKIMREHVVNCASCQN